MTLLPSSVIKLAKGTWREITAYSFYRSRTSELVETDLFKSYKIRRAKDGNIHWVINLPPELLMSGRSNEKDLIDSEKSYVASQTHEINSALAEAEILDMIRVENNRIKTEEYYAYWIKIKFNFVKFTFWNILYILSYFSAIATTGYFIIKHFAK